MQPDNVIKNLMTSNFYDMINSFAYSFVIKYLKMILYAYAEQVQISAYI